MTNLAIQMHHVSKRFGTVEAVKDLYLDIPQGDIVGILGPNGAGKTTTIHILLGFVRPDQGTVAVWGLDPGRHRQRIRAMTGYVMQQSIADRYLTGRENALLYAELLNVPTADCSQRVEELLTWAGLADAADQLVLTYSGGMLRRLEIALSLVHRPPLIILDEPTIGLDIHSRRQLWDVIIALKQTGTTVLLTTHYLEEARHLCDAVAILHQGAVVSWGAPARLIEQFAHERHCLVVVFDTPLVCETLQVPIHGQVDGFQMTFHGAPTLLWQTLGVLQHQYGAHIQHVSYTQPTLDDVFLHLTTTT